MKLQSVTSGTNTIISSKSQQNRQASKPSFGMKIELSSGLVDKVKNSYFRLGLTPEDARKGLDNLEAVIDAVNANISPISKQVIQSVGKTRQLGRTPDLKNSFFSDAFAKTGFNTHSPKEVVADFDNVKFDMYYKPWIGEEAYLKVGQNVPYKNASKGGKNSLRVDELLGDIRTLYYLVKDSYTQAFERKIVGSPVYIQAVKKARVEAAAAEKAEKTKFSTLR